MWYLDSFDFVRKKCKGVFSRFSLKLTFLNLDGYIYYSIIDIFTNIQI